MDPGSPVLLKECVWQQQQQSHSLWTVYIAVLVLLSLSQAPVGPRAGSLQPVERCNWDKLTVWTWLTFQSFSVTGSHGGNWARQLCWGHSSDSWIHTSHPLIVPLVHAPVLRPPARLASLSRSLPFSRSDLLHVSSHLYFRIICAGLVGRWAKSQEED